MFSRHAEEESLPILKLNSAKKFTKRILLQQKETFIEFARVFSDSSIYVYVRPQVKHNSLQPTEKKLYEAVPAPKYTNIGIVSLPVWQIK